MIIPLSTHLNAEILDYILLDQMVQVNLMVASLFYHRFDFDLVRKALLRTSRQPIRDTNIIVFGELNVIGTPNYEK